MTVSTILRYCCLNRSTTIARVASGFDLVIDACRSQATKFGETHEESTKGGMMRLLGLLLGIGLVLWGFVLGGNVGLAFDVSTFMVIVLGAFAFAMMAHGRDVWVALDAAVFGKKIADGQRRYYVKVLHTLRQTMLAMGFVAALIGGANMSAHMDSWLHFGPAFAVLLLAPLYGVLFGQLMILPLVNRLDAAAIEATASRLSDVTD